MGFCLVAQPWTYKKIGGPSRLPKDFHGPSQITTVGPGSYFMTGPLLVLFLYVYFVLIKIPQQFNFNTSIFAGGFLQISRIQKMAHYVTVDKNVVVNTSLRTSNFI